jgi:predicted amidophosphoribosyltransferase
MKVINPPRITDQGLIEPAHVIAILCAECGYDLDESELEADTCSDCGNPLSLRQNVEISVTTTPASRGATLP